MHVGGLAGRRLLVLSEAGQLLRGMPTLVGGGRTGEGKISRGIANCLFKALKSSLPYNQALPFQTTLHPRCHPGGGAPRLSRSVLDIQGKRLTRPPIKSSSSLYPDKDLGDVSLPLAPPSPVLCRAPRRHANYCTC